MLRNIFCCLLTLLFFTRIYSQEECKSSVAEIPPADFYYYTAYNPQSYTLKIKFWLVGNDNGTNRFDPNQVNSVLNHINSVYNPFQVYFVNAGVSNINSTAYNYLNYKTEEYKELFDAYYTNNVINFYIVNDIDSGIGGLANDKKAIVESSLALTSTTIHEIGHVLGLSHTLRRRADNSIEPGCETETSSNCSTCHDYLCDTTMSAGENYMYPTSGSGFSESQKYKMKNTIEFNRARLMETTRVNYTPYIRKSNELSYKYVCVDGYNTFDLVGNAITQHPVTWTVSSNLSVHSISNNNRVTIKGLSNGTGTLTASFNGTSITINIKIGSPTNIVATPYSSGYILSCSQPDYYQIDYVDLDTNQSGTTYLPLSNSTQYSGSNYFYFVNSAHNFKFRLINYYNCKTPSEWVTVAPNLCPANNHPTNLSFITPSMCGGNMSGRCCGYGHFTYSAVPGATSYQVEYMGVNLTNATVPPITGTFQTSSTNTIQPTTYACSTNQAGTWIIKYRVKSKCANGTWSDFSPWSANFAW